MHGPMIDLLTREYRSRHEGPVPPPHELVWQDWVGPFLRVLAVAPGDDATEDAEITEERTSHAV